MATRVIVPMPETIIPLFGKELVAIVDHDNKWKIEGLEKGKFRNTLVDLFRNAGGIRGFDENSDAAISLSLRYALRVVRSMDVEFPGIHIAEDNDMGGDGVDEGELLPLDYPGVRVDDIDEVSTLEEALENDDVSDKGSMDDPRPYPEIPVMY